MRAAPPNSPGDLLGLSRLTFASDKIPYSGARQRSAAERVRDVRIGVVGAIARMRSCNGSRSIVRCSAERSTSRRCRTSARQGSPLSPPATVSGCATRPGAGGRERRDLRIDRTGGPESRESTDHRTSRCSIATAVEVFRKAA